MADAQRWVSAPEFTEWMAYHALEPFGPDATAWGFGMVASVIANANRDPKRRSQPYTPQDFMPDEPMTPAERAADVTARITSAMMSLGGRVARPGERRTRKALPPSRARDVLRAGINAAPTRPARTRRPRAADRKE